jgi:tripartite-type tricarboxylate transporter receptor subunit TctC
MRIDRRGLSSGLAASLAIPSLARAQAPWPAPGSTIRVVVPFPPAGATDIIARIMGDKLARMWNANVVVDNKAGGGANIGAEFVARAAPDGSTLMLTAPFAALNNYLYKSLGYNPEADFAHISLVALVPNMLVAGKHLNISTTPELIALAKANPGKLTFASSGVGTSIHLAGELFKAMAGVDMVHVPYRGSAPAIQDIIGGRVDVMFDNISSSIEQVRSGQLKGVAITTAKRSALAPDLPPVADALPGYDVSSWFGFSAPAKTPAAIVDKVGADVKTALADPDVRKKLEALAAEPVGSSPAEFAAFVKKESAQWGKLITERHISAE